jgi:hypothetical protein
MIQKHVCDASIHTPQYQSDVPLGLAMATGVAREKARNEPETAPDPALERLRGAKAETDVDRNKVESMAVVFILRFRGRRVKDGYRLAATIVVPDKGVRCWNGNGKIE